MYIVHDQTNETTTLKRFSLSVCQSVIQPVYQSAHQLINQLVVEWISQSIIESCNASVCVRKLFYGESASNKLNSFT